MTLGAMAAEHVFYGENSQGVSGDLQSATATAAAMVGMWGMGPDAVAIDIGLTDDGTEEQTHVNRRLERIGNRIMNRASAGSSMMGDPVAAVLGDRDKRSAAAQLLGQAYVTAYSLIATNRVQIEQIADTLVERKELHGDEVGDLLDSVALVRPQIDLTDERTWPTV
jgi:ATP-dependent Zn protease